MLAERAIIAVLHRYCHAIDRLDAEALRSVYASDATDDHGAYSGDAAGFVEWVLDRLPKAYVATQHSISNIRIDVHGDVAFAESDVVAGHVLPPSPGSGLYTLVGRYIDRLELAEDGVWRIAHRQLLRTWENVSALTRVIPGGFAPTEPSPHTDGRRSRDDLSYGSIGPSPRTNEWK